MFDLSYRDLDSHLHRLGTPAKATLFGSLFLLSMLYSDVLFLISIIVTCLILALVARLGHTAKAYIRAFLLFSAIILAINLLVNQRGEHPLLQTSLRFYWWSFSFRITLESISSALKMVLRLLAVILSFLLFTLTTKPESLLSRLSTLRGMEEFGLVLALAYRFLPTLVSDGTDMKHSLLTRGVRFEEAGRLGRMRAYAQLGVPLIVNSLDRSFQLAEAMDSRGYGSGRHAQQSTIPTNTFSKVLSLYYLFVLGIFSALWVLLGIGKAPILTTPSNLPFSMALVGLFVTPLLLRRPDR